MLVDGECLRLRAIAGTVDRAVLIRRADEDIGGGAAELSPAQADAYRAARDLVALNAPGDREAALGALQAAFEEVSELPE